MAALGSSGGLGAQQPVIPLEHPVAPGDSLTVYLMTMGPGEQVWERFGHNAIWIHDARTGADRVWNWGLFSFGQEDFIPRLIRGEMMYWMGGFTLDSTLREYEHSGRAVWAQELALTPEQEVELDRLIRLNAEPENVFYRYDYYRDNCSTRVRDMLDAVLGGALRSAYASQPTGTTWRWHTLRLLDRAPLPRTGVQIVLGNPGDEEIDAWQEMFLPLRLRAYVDDLEVAGPDGRPRPLVVREVQLVEGRTPAPARAPRGREVTFLVAGLVGAGALVILAVGAARGSATARWLLALAGAAWCAVAGVIGLLLVGAYLTDHVFWHANENLLQASPLHLLLGAGALLLIGRRTSPAWVVTLARWIAAFACLGLVGKLWSGFGQGNLEIVALTLPLNLALAWALGHLAAPRVAVVRPEDAGSRVPA